MGGVGLVSNICLRMHGRYGVWEWLRCSVTLHDRIHVAIGRRSSWYRKLVTTLISNSSTSSFLSIEVWWETCVLSSLLVYQPSINAACVLSYLDRSCNRVLLNLSSPTTTRYVAYNLDFEHMQLSKARRDALNQIVRNSLVH